jgi:hypothetical protein
MGRRRRCCLYGKDQMTIGGAESFDILRGVQADPPQLFLPSCAGVRGEPGSPIDPLPSVTFETRLLSD